MACPEKCVATGKVSRIFTTEGANGEGVTNIRLADPVLLEGVSPPADGYFWVDTNHPNYNALYSLILVAATNQYNLRVRTETDINDQEAAHIRYLVVDWP